MLVRSIAWFAVVGIGVAALPGFMNAPPLAAPPAPKVSPPVLVTTGPLKAFEDGVTYELAQYIPETPGASTRLVDLPGSPPTGGASPVYASPNDYRRQVVGWLFVEDLGGGVRLQRWLLLHAFDMVSEHDTEVKPATYMGGAYAAPTTSAGFKARAEYIFNAAKVSSPDPPRDRTRYAKIHSTGSAVLDHLDDLPADSLPSAPAYPEPDGNGAWDGDPGAQLDVGTVGIFLTGTATNALVAVMQESNAGTSGTEAWFLSDDYESPTTSDPLVFATLDYSQQSGIGTTANLSEVIPANPIGTRREWNALREAGTYYSLEFPDADP